MLSSHNPYVGHDSQAAMIPPPQLAASQTSEAPRPRSTQAALRILFAARESGPLAKVQQTLYAGGHKAALVSNVGAVLQQLSAKPDLAILELDVAPADILLRLVRNCHQQFPSVPLVVAAHPASMQVVYDALRNGASDYVKLPTEAPEVAFRINRVLQASRADAELNSLRCWLKAQESASEAKEQRGPNPLDRMAECENSLIATAEPAGGAGGSTIASRLAGDAAAVTLFDPQRPFHSTLAEVEKEAIVQTLRTCKGNKAKAARSLGISEKSIYNKMRRLKITEYRVRNRDGHLE